MDIDDYQSNALETVQFDKTAVEAKSIALLGITGELGVLAAEYKKKIRDGNSYEVFEDKVAEELGDIIWYVSLIATLEGLQLSTILQSNLEKIEKRWGNPILDRQFQIERDLIDDGLPENEKLPREFVAEFIQSKDKNGRDCIRVTVNGEVFGGTVRDNNYSEDYYRFHDIFHIAYATVLGWSPVVRKFLERKRADEVTDEVEDGGRALVIDETISIVVFEKARLHKYFEGVYAVDYELLRTIKNLTQHLEIKHATEHEWQNCILLGFKIWRQLRDNGQGRVVCNLEDRTMMFEKI